MLRAKAPWEIAMMRAAGQRLAEVQAILQERAVEGITGLELDSIAEEAIRARESIPAFKGYKAGGDIAFPATLCISYNEEIVHGIPSERPFKAGDVISIDMGLVHNGYFADRAFTVAIGEVDEQVKTLLAVTEESLYKAVSCARPGARLGDVGNAVESFVDPYGFGIIRDYVGHGIGRALHEPPSVPNYGKPGTGILLKPGMCLAFEPMITLGTHKTRVLADGWTVVTTDGSIAAHFEHTLVITHSGAEILTELR